MHIIVSMFFIIFQFDRETVVYLAVCFVHRNMVCDKRTYMNIDVKKKGCTILRFQYTVYQMLHT